ncbi:MAG: hypothetical protein QM742_13145 [Aquabacterium sp.]
MDNIGSNLKQQAVASGARFRAVGKVDLATVQRKAFSWFGKSIQAKLGVATKPKPFSTCPLCQQAKQDFQLDHMGPWRVYVAAAAGPHIQMDPMSGALLIDRDIVKVLYNDPENLWWICSDCNRSKSDMTYDTAAQLEAIAQGTIPKGDKGVDPSDILA